MAQPTNADFLRQCIEEHRQRTKPALPIRRYPVQRVKPLPIRHPPVRYPRDPAWPVPIVDPPAPVNDLAGMGCGCEGQQGAGVTVEQKDFTLDPIFKWGVLGALIFLALRK